MSADAFIHLKSSKSLFSRNVVYENPHGIDGTHSYSVRRTDEKLEWLRKDRATVDKQTPVFVGMHVPLHKTPTLDDTGRTTTSYNMEDAERFVECLEGYDVNILTGHTHYNFNITKSYALHGGGRGTPITPAIISAATGRPEDTRSSKRPAATYAGTTKASARTPDTNSAPTT